MHPVDKYRWTGQLHPVLRPKLSDPYSPQRRKDGTRIIPFEVVEHARWLHEEDGRTVGQVCSILTSLFPTSAPFPRSTVSNWLHYNTRVKE